MKSIRRPVHLNKRAAPARPAKQKQNTKAKKNLQRM